MTCWVCVCSSTFETDRKNEQQLTNFGFCLFLPVDPLSYTFLTKFYHRGFIFFWKLVMGGRFSMDDFKPGPWGKKVFLLKWNSRNNFFDPRAETQTRRDFFRLFFRFFQFQVCDRNFFDFFPFLKRINPLGTATEIVGISLWEFWF